MKNDITIKNSSMDVYDYCEKNGISLAKIEENEFVAVPLLMNKVIFLHKKQQIF